MVFTLQAQDKERVAGPMIDPLTNKLFQVSMHYKIDCLTKSGDGAWSAAPTVEDRAGPSSPSGPIATLSFEMTTPFTPERTVGLAESRSHRFSHD